MATGVQVWSQTPVTNATADSNINWSEGMAPSQVNDSARAVMSSVAKWRDDSNGTLLTSGTTSAVTLVTNQVESALTSGYTVRLMFGSVPDTNATLAVDGLTATNMQVVYGTNISYGQFNTGQIYSFMYTTGTGASAAWLAQNYPYPIITTSTAVIPGNPFTPLLGYGTNTLATTVNMSTASYTDAVSVTGLSSSGVYFASGNVYFSNSATNGRTYIRLWDGTTVVTEQVNVQGAAAAAQACSISGIVANPAGGTIKISGQIGLAAETGGFFSKTTSTAVSTGLATSYLSCFRLA